MNNTLEARKRSPLQYAAWALLVLSPWLLLAVLTLVTGRNAFAGVPVWSDELDYWRSVFSWLNVGGNTGYYGLNEWHAPIGQLSSHGPTHILLYVPFARLFGWSLSGVVLCNALWISAGALTLVLLLKPGTGVSLALALSVLGYAPNVLYSVTSMTETANYGMLLLFAAFLLRYRRTRGVPSLVFCLLSYLLLIVYRISYLILLLPLVWILGRERVSWRALGAVVALGVASLAVYWATSLFTSPYPDEFVYNFLHTGDVGISIRMFLSHAKANLRDYFITRTDYSMEVAQRWLYCITMGLCGLGSFLHVSRKERKPHVHFDALLLVCFLVLFAGFALVVCAYETNDWADYRTIAPLLWFVFALLALRGRKFIPGAFLAGCAVILVVMGLTHSLDTFVEPARYEPAPYNEEIQALCEAIPYDPNAEDPYENTVRIDLCDLQTTTELHPGLGLQSGWFTEENTGKSRWILTDRLKCAVVGYEPVLTNASGCVYRLTDSAQ